MSKEHDYSIAWLERFINKSIAFVFYYRLIYVFLAVLVVATCGCHVYNTSGKEDALKNLCFTLTAGSIITGIFYSILNYEHNHRKSKDDAKFSRLHASFNVSCEWSKPTMVENLKITKKLHNQHKHLCDENRAKDFFEILEKDEEARSALVSILNYLELLAVGIEEGILDETMIKKYFKTMFYRYLSNYGFYIDYRRKIYNNPTAWEYFTAMATKWNKSN
jgi:hypothetical protein